MSHGKHLFYIVTLASLSFLVAACTQPQGVTESPGDDAKQGKKAATSQDAAKPDEEAKAADKSASEKSETDKPAGDKGDEKPTDKPDESEENKAADNKPAADTPAKPDDKLAADAPASDDQLAAADEKAVKPKELEITKEWAQWAGSPQRNNTPVGRNIPHQWTPGAFDGKQWQPETAKNVKWVAALGSQTYGNATVADGKVFVGTNNRAGWLKRYPSEVDLGCLIAFNAADGKFLWQHSSEKLPTGRVHDWPLQGICCAPLVEGKRLWFVTSRGEVRCLDTEGFHDKENDGPYKDETNENIDEADVIWVFNMMKELDVSQHNMCSCSVTAYGDILFVNTSNGLDESHILLPQPNAPSFFAMNKNTGEVLWTDKSPGENILHGQWSSPAFAKLGGQPQVIFGGGDGWVYSFHAEGENGKSKLLWKFDANPKESKWELGGRGTRNNIIATPVIHNGLVYVAVGQDPEHAEGNGHLWCIDPAKKMDGSDVSPQLVFNLEDPSKPIPHRRLQACDPKKGEVARDNPNSAVVWHYAGFDLDGNGKLAWEEEMHRSCGTVAVKDDILYISDFSGLFHCLDAKTGKAYWTHDMLAAAWGSPLIVDGKVYIGDEDGDILVFKHSKEMEILSRDEDGEPGPINMGNSVVSTPIVADNVLYISNKTHLFAIVPDGEK